MRDIRRSARAYTSPRTSPTVRASHCDRTYSAISTTTESPRATPCCPANPSTTSFRATGPSAVVADATMISRSAATSRKRTNPVASVQISAMTSARLTGLLRLISTMKRAPSVGRERATPRRTLYQKGRGPGPPGGQALRSPGLRRYDDLGGAGGVAATQRDYITELIAGAGLRGPDTVSHPQRGHKSLQVIHPEFAAHQQGSGAWIPDPQLPPVVSVEFGGHHFQRLTPEIEPAVLFIHPRPGQAPGELIRADGFDGLQVAADGQLVTG